MEIHPSIDHGANDHQRVVYGVHRTQFAIMLVDPVHVGMEVLALR